MSGLAIWVTLYVFHKQRQDKRIEYFVDSSGSLLEIDSSVKSKLYIAYNGEEVKNLFSHSVRVLNTGNTAIESADYAEPLSVRWGRGFEPVASSVGEINPRDMEVTLETMDEGIVLPSILLNPGEGYTVTVLSQSAQSPFVRGRLVGGKVAESTALIGPPTPSEAIFLAVSYTATLVAFVLFFRMPREVQGWKFLSAAAVCFAALTLSIAATMFIRYAREERRWGRLRPSTIRRFNEVDN